MATVHHPELDQTVVVPDSTAQVMVEQGGWEHAPDQGPTTDPDGYPLEQPADAGPSDPAAPSWPADTLPGDGDDTEETT